MPASKSAAVKASAAKKPIQLTEHGAEIRPARKRDFSDRRLRLGIDVGSTTVKLAVIDEDAKKFMVTRARKLEEANPDVIDLSAVTGVQIDIDEDRDEEKRKDKDGKMVSYYPPRYQYSYDFDIIINVNHPYFDEIRFQLNDSRVRTGNRSINDNSARPMGFGGARPQNNAMNMANLIGAALGSAINAAASGAGSNEPWNAEYRQYLYEAEEIRDLLLQTRNEIREEKAAASAPRAKVVCPACGATTMPDANGCCEYCGCSVV